MATRKISDAKLLIFDLDASFTDWLFSEAAKKSESTAEAAPAPAATVQPPISAPEPQARQAAPARATPIYNQALNHALPSGSQSGQKRTASARSSSPTGGHPNKSRRTDLPTGPRAMHGPQGNRSLLDRMGGRQSGQWSQRNDEIQARIEAVTHQKAMGGGLVNPGFNGMPNQMGSMGMPDMNAFNAGMNPMALQEMMMNQMALMAQMANNMGMLSGQGPMMAPNSNQPQVPDSQSHGQGMNRRGTNRGRGRGASHSSPQRSSEGNNNTSSATSTPPTFAAPTSTPAAQPSQMSAGFTPPERPQSPSLCKFGLKCTNALCRYSHASPVATPESGVVLSNDPCEAGTKCTDKDCIKSHVSPAAVGIASGKTSQSFFFNIRYSCIPT